MRENLVAAGLRKDTRTEAEVDADIKTVNQEANSAKLLSRAIKGHNAREIMRREKLKEQVDKENAEDQARIEMYDPPATKINNAVRGHHARKEKERLKKDSEKISNLITKMDVAHDNLDQAIGDPGTGLTWETMKQRFDAATTITKMIKRHWTEQKYSKDELTRLNAKLDNVNALLDKSLEEQKTSGKSKKIKQAFLEIRRFWAENAKKEAQTQAENSIGVKSNSLIEKRKLLQEQQEKGEELYKIAKAIGKK